MSGHHINKEHIRASSFLTEKNGVQTQVSVI